MPVAISYPGVYVEEVSSGVRTITGVATSITAFLGRAKRGPVDAATTVLSFADFERQFGGLGETYPMSYAVRDFFVNGGAHAIIVRIFVAAFPTTEARDKRLEEVTKQAQAGADRVAEAAEKAAEGATKASTVVAAASAALRGLKGPALEAGASVVAEVYAASKKKADGTEPSASDVSAAAVNAKAKAVAFSAGAAAPRWEQARLTLIPNSGDSPLFLEAAEAGKWGNELRAAVDYKTDKHNDDPKLFNLFVKDGSTGRTETFLNVSNDSDDARYVKRVLENESSLVRVVGKPSDIMPDASAPPPNNDRFHTDSSVGVRPEDLASDGNPSPLSLVDYTGDRANQKGMYALEKADLFNLLCIPADKREGDTPREVYEAAMAYCVQRRAMLIVDPPYKWSIKPETAAAKARDGLDGDIALNGPGARNAALFFPRLKQADPMRDDQIQEFVPCGLIAGIFARTDSARGVWKAPAGIDAALVGVAGLTATLTDLENGLLNPLGINVLRAFPVYGRVVWGSRTLRGADQIADEYKYIPVRRLALFLEESLYRGTQWVVFEPNDEPLWAQIRLNIGAFMHNLFRQGAFQGTTPREAYFVKCDRETTTQSDINLGVVNIIVGYAPLKPAEFVIIKLQQIAGDIAT